MVAARVEEVDGWRTIGAVATTFEVPADGLVGAGVAWLRASPEDAGVSDEVAGAVPVDSKSTICQIEGVWMYHKL